MKDIFHETKDLNIINSINQLHQIYLDRIQNYYGIRGNDSNRFSWIENKQVIIYIIKVFSDSDYKYSTIVFAQKSDVFKILTANLIDKTNNPFFGRINDADIKKRINWLISRKLINKNILNNSIPSSFNWNFSSNPSNKGFADFFLKKWGKEWADSEFDLTSKAESNSTPVNYFPAHTQRYFFDRYHFEDMLKAIDNEQFTDELGQCIYAYQNEKWFLCASGLGSCLEHLMYIILKNYNDKGYKTLRRFPKDATASEYIRRFTWPPINIDSRQATAIRLFFMARNSIDHFNTGKTQRLFCDLLFDGLSDIYNDYFMDSVNAAPFDANQDDQSRN